MAEEVKKIITIEVGKSITSVRDFKKHIEDLRGALLGLNEDSEEYAQIAEQIATDQAKLNEVMKVGKTNTDAAAGSYIELNNQLKALRNQYKALSETERNGTTGQSILANITKLDTQLKDIDESMGQYQRNVGNYKQAFDGAFKMISSEVSKINPTLGNLLTAVQKLVPAFKGVGTAAGAAGTSIKSAMASTGIGLLVVALGEIVAHWEEITEWINKALGKQKELTTETGKTADELNRAAEAARNYNFQLNLARGLSQEDALKIQLEDDKKALDDLEYNVKRATTWMKRFQDESKYFGGGSFSDGLRAILHPKEWMDETKNRGQQIYDTFSKISIPLLKTEKEINEFKRLLDAFREDYKSGDFPEGIDNSKRSANAKRIAELFKEAIEASEEDKKKLQSNIEESSRELEKEEVKLTTASRNRVKAAQDALKTELQIRKERYEAEVEDTKKRITNEGELKFALEALEAEYAHDVQEINERAWKSSAAYQKKQQELQEKTNILQRLHEYSSSELELLQEKYAKEKELIKDNEEAIEQLTLEFMEKRHDIVKNSEYNTEEELTNAYNREIEVRKLYNLAYEDLEKELQNRLTALRKSNAEKRANEVKAEMQAEIQAATDAMNTALHNAEMMWTRNTGPNSGWNFWDYLLGKGQENPDKVDEQIDKIFVIQQAALVNQVNLQNQALSQMEVGTEAYIEIERQKTETLMELDNIRYDHAVALEERRIRKNQESQKIITSLASSTASLYSSFTEIMLAEEEQGTNKWKAYKTSEAVVNTIAGALSAFMSGVNSGVPAPWNLVLAGTMAATTAAAGWAEVAKIRATKMGSTDSGSGSASASVSGVAVEPLLNQDYDLQRITNLSLQSDAYLPGNTQVYVLESDIQEVGRRVEVREQNATF